MEKFKSFFKKQKGFIILAAISIVFGYSVYTNPTPEAINSLKTQEITLLSNLDISNKELSTINEDISTLQAEVKSLKEENTQKEEILKETTAKIEQKKEEAERKKQEELEKQKQAEVEKQSKKEAAAKASNSNNNSNSTNVLNNSSNNKEVSKPVGDMVYITATGKKYHSINKCGNTNPAKTSYVSVSDAQSRGLTACSKCY